MDLPDFSGDPLVLLLMNIRGASIALPGFKKVLVLHGPSKG